MPYFLIGRAFYLSWSGKATQAQAVTYGLCCLGALLLTFQSTTGQLFAPAGTEEIVSQMMAICVFGALCYIPVNLPKHCFFFADISYSLYILHLSVGTIALDVLIQFAHLPFEIAFWPAMAFVCGVSWLSFRYIEMPINGIGKKLAARVVLRPAIAAAE